VFIERRLYPTETATKVAFKHNLYLRCDSVKTKEVMACLLKPMALTLGTQGFPVTAGEAAFLIHFEGD
jgi:hypothetical protein